MAAVRVGRINGSFAVNPSAKELLESDLNVVVAGSRDAVVMVEGGADFVSEDDLVDAIDFGHKAILPILDAQDELQRRIAPVRSSSEVVGMNPSSRLSERRRGGKCPRHDTPENTASRSEKP